MPGSGFRTFWEAEEAKDAIALLSGQARLVVFVGAGVSKEAGLPSWAELLDMLLRRTARASDPFRARLAELRQQGVPEPARLAQVDADAASYSRWITATHGLLGAAAVVKAWLGSGDYHRVVQETLYSPVTDSRLPLQPGPTAIAVASLWTRVGFERMTVVTTNYDLLLERALEEVGVGQARIRTVIDLSDTIAGAFEVVHLHGVLPEPHSSGGTSKDIILAEDEFFDPAGDGGDASRYCEAALSAGSCLFVGTSFTDPNLLGYLYSSAMRGVHDREHVAVMVKQGEQPPQIEASSTVMTAGREAAAARLARVNVRTLQPSFFSQTAHVLGEIEPSGQNHLGFLNRLDTWSRRAIALGLLPNQAAAFLTRQPILQRALAEAVDGIRGTFAVLPSLRCDDELLSLQLWVHDAEREELVFVGRSDQQFLDPGLLERENIAMPIRRLVVEAVCSGAVLEASGAALQSSRWESMLVVPLNAGSSSLVTETGTLPIGALVLASSLDAPRGLQRLRDAVTERQLLVRTLAEIGELLLNPPEDDDG